jgi:hypothetical protein
MPVLRAAGAVAALLASFAVVATPAAAQDGDLCYALTLEELSAAAPATYAEPTGFPDNCSWQGTSSAGETVMVVIYSFPSALSDLEPTVEATETTIAGYPALTGLDTTTDPPGGAAGVEVGANVVLVLVSSSDPGVDLVGVATQLASAAAPRVAEAGPSDTEPGTDPGTETGESTHPEPCTLFSAEELSEALGETLSPLGDSGSCRWDSDSGSSISVAFDRAGLTATESLFAGGEHITVAGQPAYQVDLTFGGFPTSQVSVDLGPDTIALLVSSSDATFDAATLAAQLMETAFTRGLQVLPEPEGVVTTCQLASPEEIAAAAGLDFDLTLTDYETFCTYEGGGANKHVIIQVASQTPATIGMAIEALGGTEIEGPGDQSWWLKDYGSLTSLQGDLALQITLLPDKQTPDAKLQEMAIAIMEVLLAP